MKMKDKAVENKFSKTLQVKEKAIKKYVKDNNYTLFNLSKDIGISVASLCLELKEKKHILKISDELEKSMFVDLSKALKEKDTELAKLEKENKVQSIIIEMTAKEAIKSLDKKDKQISTLQKELENVRKGWTFTEQQAVEDLAEKDKVWQKFCNVEREKLLNNSLHQNSVVFDLKEKIKELKTQNKKLEKKLKNGKQ